MAFIRQSTQNGQKTVPKVQSLDTPRNKGETGGTAMCVTLLSIFHQVQLQGHVGASAGPEVKKHFHK